ncbi:MAG: hypothetical protein AWU59_456 [Methanolobus sp. T82-4]|jgi:hypothetical protein|nr:MAG: hypothetical protein AWU59_456 [Methanolobus sp. T82-4]
MFHECFFCDRQFGYEAIEKGYLRKVGSYLLCANCLADLKDAMGSSVVEEVNEDQEIDSHAMLIFET